MACILLTIFFLSLIGISSFKNPALAISNAATSVTATQIETAPEAQIPVENTSITPWIASNKADYSPGALVILTGGGWTGDSEVKIVIEGSSSNSQDWKLEKVISAASDGLVELQFNLPEWYIPQYKVTATDLTTGGDVTTTFTDTGSAYNLDFSAYNPKYYDFKLPSDYPTPPSLRAADPMPGTVSSHTVESLEPEDLALGQIVPFEVKINVNGNTDKEKGVINFSCLWDTITTNKSDFGFDPKYMVFAAFADTADPDSIDTGEPASVIFSPEMDGTCIKGNFQVSGLNQGDRIIVEMWVVLKSKLPDGGANGNVQSNLVSAETAAGDKITKGSGNQTVPLNQIDKFTTVTSEVGIVKSDKPDPLYAGDTLTYSVTVTNNSADVVANGIVVSDKLDSNVTFVGASDGGNLNSGLITWPAFALEPGKQKIFSVTVNVNPNAPTEKCVGTAPDTGSATLTPLTDADITNIVQFTMITQDSNLNNNVWQEPTNVLPNASVTAYKVWVGGPEEDHKLVALTLYRKVGSGEREVVTGVKPTITPSTGTSDRFTYTWTGLPMYDANFQPYIYFVDELTVPANYTKTITENNTVTNTYKPSLTILKVYGTGPLEGAVFQLYKGDDNGRTGDPLGEAITTDINGKATFEHLADGTYWIVEAKPPTGYKWMDDIGPIKVANGAITGPAGFTLAADGTTGNYTVTIPNEPVRKLPATGGVGTVPFATGGLGLMILAISLEKRKRINRKRSGRIGSNKM